MSFIEIALLVLAVALFVPIVVVFARHRLEIAAIQVREIPEEKQQRVKVIMAEARLQRKFQKVYVVIQKVLQPVVSLFKTMTSHWRERIAELEKQYKIEKLTLKSATQSGQESLQHKARQLLTQAKRDHDTQHFQQAEDLYIQVIQLDPQSVDAFLGLADVYHAQKKHDQAREVYHYVLKMMNDIDASALHMQVISEKSTTEEQHNIVAAQRANVHWSLAGVYQDEKNLAAAERELDRALKLEPSNPRYLDAQLDISIMKKDKIKAQDLFFKLKAVNPDNKKLIAFEEKIADL